ncbi:MAG: YraN family protein [Pseudomonadota bacterium]
MTRKATGQIAYYAGEAAEASVARIYERAGLLIAHTRWRGPSGEIDLVARDGDTIVFVEVKKSNSFDRAAAQLSPRQCRRICASAEAFVADEPRGALTNMRFDVALVNGQGAVQIIENAIMVF